jgi:hypothetical protein
MRGLAATVAVVSSLLPLGCAWDDEQGSRLLARAVEKTRDAGGARYDSEYFLALVDWSARVRQRGRVDSSGSTDAAVEVVTDRRGSAPRSTRARQRYVGGRYYLRLPPSSHWSDDEGPDGEFRINEFVSAGPAVLDDLPYLRDLRPVGPARARGVETTRYRAAVPLPQLANVAKPADRAAAQRDLWRLIRVGATGSGLRADVWLDRAGRVRRVDEELSLRLPGYDPRPTRARTEFFDFGPKRAIEAPPVS